MVAAHGNSLRGIIKVLKNISDEDIISLNLPTAVPYVFEFDDNLRLVKDYFLGDPEEIKKLMEAVANQGKEKKQEESVARPLAVQRSLFISSFLLGCRRCYLLRGAFSCKTLSYTCIRDWATASGEKRSI